MPILARVNAPEQPSRGRAQPASKAAKPAAKAKPAPAKALTKAAKSTTASSRASAPAKKVTKATPKKTAATTRAKAPTARRAAPARAAAQRAPVEAVEAAAPSPPLETVEELRTRLQSLEAQLATKGDEVSVPPAPETTTQSPASGWAAPPAAASRTSGWRIPGPSWLGVATRWVVMVAAGLVVLGLLVVSVGPKFLPYQALVVRSGSMSPTIPTGSIVFYHKEAASQVKVGQIIVFAEPNNPNVKVTHRVFSIGTGSSGRYFLTKGDANASPDNWQVPAVGTGWVAGFHVADVGYFLADLQSTTARFLLLVIPALALGGIALYETWKPRREKAQEGAAA